METRTFMQFYAMMTTYFASEISTLPVGYVLKIKTAVIDSLQVPFIPDRPTRTGSTRVGRRQRYLVFFWSGVPHVSALVRVMDISEEIPLGAPKAADKLAKPVAAANAATEGALATVSTAQAVSGTNLQESKADASVSTTYETGSAEWRSSVVEPPKPLLDLEETWNELRSITDEAAASRLADELAMELKYYLHAPRAGGILERLMAAEHGDSHKWGIRKETEESLESSGRDLFPPEPDDGSSSNPLNGNTPQFIPCAIEQTHEMTGSGSKEEIAALKEKTTYGEDLLLAIFAEDKRVQKNVPPMTYDELLKTLSHTLTNFEMLVEESPDFLAPLVAGAMVLQVGQALTFILIESREREIKPVEECARSLLDIMARLANPREMHVILKAALARVSVSLYIEVVSLIVTDVFNWFASIIPRISGRRALFLQDVVHLLDRVLFSSTKGGVPGGEVEVSPTELEESLLRFIHEMSVQQNKRKGFRTGTVEDYEEGDLEKASEGDTSCVPSASSKDDDMTEARPIVRTRKEIAAERRRLGDIATAKQDFETECGATRALLLRLIMGVIRRLPAVDGDRVSQGRSSRGPHKSRRGKTADGRNRRNIVRFLVSSRRTFVELGWDNPVHACQQCYELLSCNGISHAVCRVRDLAHPKPDRKRKAETFFGMQTVFFYLMLCLGICDEDDNRTTATRVAESPFVFLDPNYAFELVAPYLTNGLMESAPAVRLVAMELVSAFISRIPDNSVSPFRIVQTAYEGNAAQVETSFLGLCTVLMVATSAMEDPMHRVLGWDTLQCTLRKFSRASTRFSVITVLFLQTDRGAMVAQLITELKDTIREMDRAEDAGSLNGVEVSMHRDKFMELCLPRYILPRKEMLGALSPAVAASSTALFIAISDCNRLEKLGYGEGGEERKRIVRRLEFLQSYLKIGRDAFRAIAAVSEHDRHALPKSKLAKEDVGEARAMYESAGRTLNDCVASLSSIDTALDKIRATMRSTTR